MQIEKTNVQNLTIENNQKELDLIKNLKKKNVKEKDIASYLKKNNIDLNKLDSLGYNCLHYAIKSENPDIVNLFLTVKEDSTNDNDINSLSFTSITTTPANPNIKTNDIKKNIYLSPIHLCFQEVNDPINLNKIIKILIKHNANLKTEDDYGYNTLSKAGEKGSIDLIDFILDKSPEIINFKGKNGTLLHTVVNNDNDELLEHLLKFYFNTEDKNNSLDLSAVDSSNNNALLCSVIMNNYNCFKLILDFIIDTNEDLLSKDKKIDIIKHKNSEGNTLLHELALARCGNLLEYMFKINEEFRIDPESKNNEGLTYMDIQKNIVKIKKEKEEKQKKEREEFRKEKIRLKQEKIKEEEERKENEKKRILEEEKNIQFRENIVKNRGYILCGLILFMFIGLYLVLQNAANKKKSSIII